MTYVDTSLLVAYYCPERLSDAAQTALRKVRAAAISWLVEVELVSAVARKVRAGELDEAEAGRIVVLFHEHQASGYFLPLPIESSQYALAREWIGRFSTPLRTLDALHLAVAYTANLRLLTADKGLARSADHFGVKHELLS